MQAVASSNESAGNEAAGNRRHGWSVFILAFTAVLREGIESIVFLAGVGSNTSFKAIPLACVAGLVVGLAVGAIVYWSGHSIKDLKIFFAISTFVLFFIAAGQVSLGTQLLSVAGAFGKYAAWTDELTWQYRPIADYSYCCSDDPVTGNQFFVLSRAVFGYTARPTPMVVLLYCTYWAAVIVALVWKWHNGSLFDADYKRNRTHLKLSRTLASKQRQLARLEKQLVKAQAAGNSTKAQECSSKIAKLQQEVKETEAELKAEQERLDEDDRRTAVLLGTAKPEEEAAKDVEFGRGGDRERSSEDSDSADFVADAGGRSKDNLKALEQEQRPSKKSRK
jgi:high-affinity iron transporter